MVETIVPFAMMALSLALCAAFNRRERSERLRWAVFSMGITAFSAAIAAIHGDWTYMMIAPGAVMGAALIGGVIATLSQDTGSGTRAPGRPVR